MTQATVFQDRFALRERLFSEGNQAAYAAHDRLRREDVLLFLIPPSAKLAEDVDRAVRGDIERAFSVSAPSLLPVLDLREIGEYRFLVMPRPRGTNAWSLITQEKKAPQAFTADMALKTADDLLAAAQAAHRNDTILGCSPKQVWVDCRRGGAQVQYYWLERVVLSNGDATSGTGGRFKTLGIEGAYFQAPELEKGREGAQPPADQFFISAVLYGLITGEVPGGTLAPIRRTRKNVPKPLARAIEKGLAQDPAARHASLDAFRRALHRKPAKLTGLVPLLLLLLGLWAGYALFRGGATPDDFAFQSEVEARRQAAFEDSRPRPEPVPRATPEAVARFAGRYACGAEFELTVRRDGTFLLIDGTRDGLQRTRGLWWDRPTEAHGIQFVPLERGSGRQPVDPIEAHAEAGRLHVAWPPGETLVFTKTSWPRGAEGTLGPLVELDQPLVGRVLADAKFRVAGRVAVPETKVVVNGEDLPVVGTRFDTEVEAPRRGDYTLDLEATAPDGFQSRLTRTVRIDTGPPSLEAIAVLERVEGIWTLRVTGTAKDDGDLVAVTVNDEPASLEEDGTFRLVRKGANAVAHAFAEVVALDDAGSTTRRLLWPEVTKVRPDTLKKRFEAVGGALADGRTADAEELMRGLRSAGGLIEQMGPEKVAKLVLGGRTPRIRLDDYLQWPRYYTDDGTRTIELRGSVDWFGPDDVLTVGGREVRVVDKAFTARVQLARLGSNRVPIQVTRAGKPVQRREIEVWLAAAAGEFPAWTGVAVSDAQRAASARHGLPLARKNSLGMRFVLVPPGSFTRRTEDGRRYEVRLTRPYYLQITEVTREQFQRYGRAKLPEEWRAPSGTFPLGGEGRPALYVTRLEAAEFARRLSSAEGEPYRLPTEAEWEYAARGGDDAGDTYWGSDRAKIPAWGNFADRSVRDVAPGWPARLFADDLDDGHAGPWRAGTGRANRFGLKDMLGNAAEWVADTFAPYDPAETENPVGRLGAGQGIRRGGSFRQKPEGHGFSSRTAVDPEASQPNLGFRLMMEAGGR